MDKSNEAPRYCDTGQLAARRPLLDDVHACGTLGMMVPPAELKRLRQAYHHNVYTDGGLTSLSSLLAIGAFTGFMNDPLCRVILAGVAFTPMVLLANYFFRKRTVGRRRLRSAIL
jgi:hypothetical protein